MTHPNHAPTVSRKSINSLYLEANQGAALGTESVAVEISGDWQVVRGPHGGYLAGLMLEAMAARQPDQSRQPRLLSVHYPSPPRPGAAEIRTRVERSGRSVTWASAELWQGAELRLTSRAAFSSDWPSVEYAPPAPLVAPPERGVQSMGQLPPFTRHFEYRSLFASPLAPATHEAVGGWIRPRLRRRYDTATLAILSDAWFPATLAFDARPVMGSTLDLTVHFRDHAALRRLREDDFVLTVFRSQLATEGFFEESGELWSPDGSLLAQSRQLAIATPLAE